MELLIVWVLFGGALGALIAGSTGRSAGGLLRLGPRLTRLASGRANKALRRAGMVVSGAALLATSVLCSPQVVSPTSPQPSSTPTPSARIGVVRFGADYRSDTLEVTSPASEFSVGTRFAYEADLLGPANAAKLTVIWAKESSPGGSESVALSLPVVISNPQADTIANAAVWSVLLQGPGSYVVRVLRDNTVLAEGRFQLVAAAALPPPTPTPNRQLTVTASGFGVQSSMAGYGFASSLAGYGFTIRNESAAEAAESVRVQIAWLDAAGVVVGTAIQLIAVLWPGEHTGVADTTSSHTGAVTMTVSALATKWTATNFNPGFTFTNLAYEAPLYVGARVTGVIRNVSTKNLQSVRVSAIGVDSEGRIVGGGWNLVDLLAGSATAVLVDTYEGATPAKVVMYAQLTTASLLYLQIP